MLRDKQAGGGGFWSRSGWMLPFGAVRGFARGCATPGRPAWPGEREGKRKKGGISHCPLPLWFRPTALETHLLGVPQIMGGQLTKKERMHVERRRLNRTVIGLPRKGSGTKGWEMMRLRPGCLSCDGRSWLLICRRGCPNIGCRICICCVMFQATPTDVAVSHFAHASEDTIRGAERQGVPGCQVVFCV